MRCHVDLSQDPLRVQPFLSKADHFPPNSVMLELFIQESCVTMCSTRVHFCCIFRWGLRGHEEIDLHLRVVLSSKNFLLGFAIRWDKDVRQWEKTKDARNTRFFVSRVFRYGKQMKAVNSWRAKVSNADGFKRRRDHRLCPLLKILRERETSRNYRDWRSLRFIKLLNQSVLWDSNFQRAQDADQIWASVSMLEFLCDSICVVLWKEHTSTEATIPSLNYARTIILTANCVAGQSSPHHGKECGELGDQHKATNLFEWILWKKSIHWQNLFHWCLAAWGGNLDDRSGKSDAGCHSRGSASAAKWRYYQSLSGWGLEILHDFGCSWINGYIWWCYVLLRTRYCTSGNNYK